MYLGFFGVFIQKILYCLFSHHSFMYNGCMDTKWVELVRTSRLFEGIKPGLLPVIIERSLRRSVEEDGYYFMQSDPASHAYILVEGLVKMLQVTPDGQQIALRIITPGETYGGVAGTDRCSSYTWLADASCAGVTCCGISRRCWNAAVTPIASAPT